MITRPSRPPHRTSTLVRGTGMAAAALAVGLTLAACGGAAAPDAGSAARQSADDGGGTDDDGGVDGGGAAVDGTAPSERRTIPGVSGEVAALNGDIAQVQGGGSQTAVTWTAETVVTQQVAGSLADVTVGSCVSAFAAPSDADGGAVSIDDTTPLDAATVTISPADEDGTCGSGRGAMADSFAGGGFPGGGRALDDGPSDEIVDVPSDASSDLPTNRPSGFPSGPPDGGGRDGAGFRGSFGISGTVTAVSDTGFTVEQTVVAGPGPDDAGQDDADPDAADQETAGQDTTTREVTVSAETAYTATQTAATSAIAVGQCLTALGEEDSAGTITADTITLSEKTDDGCSTGVGGGRFPGGEGRAGRGPGAQDSGAQDPGAQDSDVQESDVQQGGDDA